MVERGHFKELQTIMDMLPKTERELDEKPPQKRKRRREAPKEDADEEQEEDENVEVYPDSDDDNAEEPVDEEQEANEEQGDDELDDEQEGDEDQEIVAEDVDMEAEFPDSTNIKPVKKRQTLVFSATLALPPGFKKKLKRGFFDNKSVSKNEYSVASLIQKAAMRSNAEIVDLTTKDILAKKLEESVIE
jgi:hypothetical protein